MTLLIYTIVQIVSKLHHACLQVLTCAALHFSLQVSGAADRGQDSDAALQDSVRAAVGEAIAASPPSLAVLVQMLETGAQNNRGLDAHALQVRPLCFSHACRRLMECTRIWPVLHGVLPRLLVAARHEWNCNPGKSCMDQTTAFIWR